MKLTWKNTESFLKSPPADIPAVLVYGPDDGLVRERCKMLTKTVIRDDSDPFAFIDMPGDSLLNNPSRLIDEAQSISLLGGRKVIFVRDADDKIAPIVKDVLAALTAQDNFIVFAGGDLGPRSALRLLCEDAKNAASLPCYVEDERDLSRVIQDAARAEGKTISADAVAYVARHIVGDRGVARQELQKLMLYAGPQKNIDLDDAQNVIGNVADLSIDDLARHAASGQFAPADRILRQALAEGTPAVVILRTLQNYFLRLHVTKLRLQSGIGLDAALAQLRPPLFFKVKDAFAAQVNAWDIAGLEQALSILQTAEARAKQTGFDPDLHLSRAVLALAQTGSKRQARRA
jgi:DNA polymerase-3 subunit delta